MKFKKYLDDESIMQALAKKDINSKVDGDTVVVDKDDVKTAKSVIKSLGCNHEVKAGLNK